jgi:hypothetical protein
VQVEYPAMVDVARLPTDAATFASHLQAAGVRRRGM